jgi:hypothetical protein
MLKFNVLYNDSDEQPVASGATVTAEGQALVGVFVDGVFGVRPSSGVANEKFMGVSIAQQLTLEYMAAAEELTVPAAAAYEITLGHTPVGGTLRLVNASGTELSAGNPAVNADEYSIADKVVTVHSSLADTVVSAYYRYELSAIEAKLLQGDIPPGGAASLVLGSVGRIKSGKIYTTEYDTSVDWSNGGAANPPVVSLGANGLFTVGGSGTELTNVTVIQIPGADNDGLLGLQLD